MTHPFKPEYVKRSPRDIVIISLMISYLLFSAAIVKGELSQSSTGTEFFVMSQNTPIIKLLYPNTTISVYINEDEIPDYIIHSEDIPGNTGNQGIAIQGIIRLNTPWKTRAGSRIISTKPIIYKQLSYRRDYSQRMTIEKYYCPVPDMSSFTNMYLASPGMHYIISYSDTTVDLIGKKSNKTIMIRKNIPFQITLAENTLEFSENKFISFNNICTDPTFSRDFFSIESSADIIPINAFDRSGRFPDRNISIDQNNDGMIDELVDFRTSSAQSGNTVPIRIIRIAPGSHLHSETPFSLMQSVNATGQITVNFQFSGITTISKEKIICSIDDEIKDNSAKIVATEDIPVNNVFYPRTNKTNSTIWFVNRTDGKEKITDYSLAGIELIQKHLYITQLSF